MLRAKDGIRVIGGTGVQTCALPIWSRLFLELEAAATAATVSWNGGVAGAHVGAYSGFVTELRGPPAGDFPLVVAVDNAPSRDVLPGLLADWFLKMQKVFELILRLLGGRGSSGCCYRV